MHISFPDSQSVAAGRPCYDDRTLVDAEWLAKGNKAGAAAVTRYQDLLGRLEEATEVHTEAKNPRGIRSVTTRSARLGDNALRETTEVYTDPAKPSPVTLLCDNADYHFSLSKTRPSSPFALTEYGKGERSLPVWKQGAGLPGEMFYNLKFAIEALAPGKRADLRAVRFDPKTALLLIEYERLINKGRFRTVVLIDPEKSWCVRKQSTDGPHRSSTTDYTYGTAIDGLHFPDGASSSSTPKASNSAKMAPLRQTSRVLAIKVTDKTPDDFRLTAFGLPEPVDVAPRRKPTPWYYWLLGAAGACAALSLGFAYLRRRMEARRSATTPKDGSP